MTTQPGELIEVETYSEAPPRRIRRGVHVRALVADIEAAVGRYRTGSHASKRSASARAVEIARALGEAAR